MHLLDSKVIIVTGAGAGIGAASARRFAEHGAHVMVTDIDGGAAAAVAEALCSDGYRSDAMRVDISDEAMVEEMVARTVAGFGRVDGAFNNAGGIGGVTVPTIDQPLSEWRRMLDITVIGNWFCMKAQIKAMRETGGGSIVFNASDAGLLGVRNMAPYAASKAALISMIRTAAIEYGDEGIRLNAVCPGATHTPGLNAMSEKTGRSVQEILGRRPINRPGEAHEIAEAAAWLLSDLSSYVTGQPLSVDGGFNASFTQ